MFIKRLVLVFALAATTQAAAADRHSTHSLHDTTMAGTSILPKESGQGAFAAIAEIVELLANDPRTDWSRVRIDLLRRHLVDMNLLTLNAEVETTILADAVIFRVNGADRTLEAIRRMVPAHAAELNRSGLLTVKAEPIEQGVALTVFAPDAPERERLKALGFFGVMAIGAHHREHHLSTAKGLMHGH